MTDDDEDPMKASRGIAYGLIISILLWMVVSLLAVFFLG